MRTVKVARFPRAYNRAVAEFEKLGAVYRGGGYAAARAQLAADPLMYDSRDLVPHAVCVGMTGSGKTGLCISLLEEAAIDGAPSLSIEPKGELSKLLLRSPQLRGEDFEPWINEGDAQKKSLSNSEYAAQQAE